MTDVPPGGPPPPQQPGIPPPQQPGYPPPPQPGYGPPPGAYPPPGTYAPPGAYQQQGYGWSQSAVGNYAGFWVRFAAALIDGLILGVPANILVAAAGDSSGAAASIQLIAFIAAVAYYTLLEGGANGQTLGKKALSIRVVDADTFHPGVGSGRGAGRYFGRILSSIPCGLGYLWMLWDPKKQTWHDKLARTCVVKA